jgi:Myb/SANT-like DNA-binding protein
MPPSRYSSTTPQGSNKTYKKKKSASHGPNAKWTNADIDSLKAKEDGNTAEGGFKTTVWKAIADSYDDPLKKKDRAAESKYTRLKKEYKDIKWLREDVSGFGWDDENKLVTATDEVWDELEKVLFYYSY